MLSDVSAAVFVLDISHIMTDAIQHFRTQNETKKSEK